MDRLRAAFEDLGYEDVATFIASGNVVFRTRDKAPDAEAAIEAALAEDLGFEVVAFVRPASSIPRLVREQPFSGPDVADAVHVGFLKKGATVSARRAVEALGNETDTVTVRGKEVYWLARAGMGRATVSGALLEKTLRQQTTLRSLKMLRRLEQKLA